MRIIFILQKLVRWLWALIEIMAVKFCIYLFPFCNLSISYSNDQLHNPKDTDTNHFYLYTCFLSLPYQSYSFHKKLILWLKQQKNPQKTPTNSLRLYRWGPSIADDYTGRIALQKNWMRFDDSDKYISSTQNMPNIIEDHIV